MKVTLGFKLSFTLTILAAAAVLLIVWLGLRCSSGYSHTTRRKNSSSCLAFMMLNIVAAAIFLSNSRSSSAGKSNTFAEQFPLPIITYQDVEEGTSKGAATVAGDSMSRHVDSMKHEDSNGGAAYDDEDSNGDADADDDDDDESDIDPTSLQVRSEKFIFSVTQGWREENMREPDASIMIRPPL